MTNHPNRSKQQQAKHTPQSPRLPWASPTPYGKDKFEISDAHGVDFTVARRVAVFDRVEDARLAHHAVNCHAELLAALKTCEEYMTACGYFAPKKDLAQQVRTAIAKAEGR